jgi:hypothetical protein
MGMNWEERRLVRLEEDLENLRTAVRDHIREADRRRRDATQKRLSWVIWGLAAMSYALVAVLIGLGIARV